MAVKNLGRITGLSAYEIWLQEGNEGTEQDFLNSLHGKDGINGVDGKDGINGIDGKNGENGKDGTNGQDGKNGQDGYSPVRGTDYWTENDVSEIKKHCDDYIDAQITQAIGGAY